jgi:hypothetical protein
MPVMGVCSAARQSGHRASISCASSAMGQPIPATGAPYETAALPASINIARVYEDSGDRTVSEEIDEAEPLKRRETGR